MITLLYAGIELLFQNGWYGAFLLPITFCTTTFAILNLNKGAPLPDSMHSMYFVVHASILFMAYACFFLSFAISMMYLIQHHEIKQHRLGALFKRLPALSDMDSSVMRLDALGLGLLVFGIITGFLWMEMAIGMPVRLSFKIGLSILVVLAYLAEHLLRIGKGWNGPKACWLSIAGFAFVLVTLLAGRHGY